MQNQQIVQCIKDGNFDDAMRLRGHNYLASYHVMNTLMRSYARSLLPAPSDDTTKVRVAVLHAGACAPGMNAAVRAVVRLGLDRGFSMVGVCGGIAGLQKWDAFELSWMDVNGWAKLGTTSSLVMRRGIVVSTDKPRVCVRALPFQLQRWSDPRYRSIRRQEDGCRGHRCLSHCTAHWGM